MKLLAPLVIVVLASAYTASAQEVCKSPTGVFVPCAADSRPQVRSSAPPRPGGHCSEPSVSVCGPCSISCPTGHAAKCTPGEALPGVAGLSPPKCVVQATCRCE